MVPKIRESLVSYTCDSGLGIIHFDDGSGNRLNFETVLALEQALQKALQDQSAKLILLRSGAEAFCLGMDLQGLEENLSAELIAQSQDSSLAKSTPNHSQSKRSQSVSMYSHLLHKIMTCPKPVIALVEGDVKAGGVGLSSACDIVVASEEASFELSEVLFGLLPYNVLPVVFELRMSPQRFRYLVLSASRLSASEAADYGLVDRVFSAEEIEKGLRSLLRTMMRANPDALASAKAFFTSLKEEELGERRSRAELALLATMKEPSVKAGLSAFQDGKTPDWFQRFKPLGPLTKTRRN